MKYNEIGVIYKAHSFRGDVKIKSYTDFGKERFKVGSILYYLDNNNYIPLTITGKKGDGGNEILHFKGFDSDVSIYPLLGKKLFALKDYSLLKDGDKHFISDYIGMDVYQGDTLKGKVIDITELPRCDYLNVLGTDGKNKMVPIMDEFIKEVNDKGIIIDDIEGILWDLIV